MAIGSSSWTLISDVVNSDVATESLNLGIECIAPDTDFQLYLDDAFFGIGIDLGIFADGFESGNTSAWS